MTTTEAGAMQDEVNIAINRLENFSAPQGDHYADTIRAHIAALAKMVRCQQIDLAGLRKLDYRVTELKNDLCEARELLEHKDDKLKVQQSEVERMLTLLLPLKGRREAFADSILGLDSYIAVDEALNPEQKGGV